MMPIDSAEKRPYYVPIETNNAPEGKTMTGKKWFYWLGKLHGSRKIAKRHHQWPIFAQESYMRGWYDGLNDVSPFE